MILRSTPSHIGSLLFLLSLWIVFPLSGKSQSVRFEPVLTIGKTESDSTEYLFSGPKEITADTRGRVFIADGSSNNIRVFNKKGHFLTTVGRRGKGPGEFLSIDHMTIDRENNLYVLDRLLRRVSILPASLSDYNTHLIEASFTDPFALYPISSGDYLIFASNTSYPRTPKK